MTNARYSDWVTNSFAAVRFEQFLAFTIQMLGRLDCHLIEEDARFGELSQAAKADLPESLRLNDRFTLSYLWVLGAYEVVRTIHQRAPLVEGLDKEVIEEIGATKRKFARLRIPLAKMEPASAHRDTDDPIAYPALHETLGVAWQVGLGTFIVRRELSDAFLEVLRHMRACDPKLPKTG